ncbi:transmembrane emp24 domain-containing protein 10 [Tetranychus urticae]|uniref:GOLD domain-containing protein n=1 Tax=Tetranychus urticae TaxID=32264 RepID=T1KY16_TETUR|nr:transmembrane emp24 domain-containing protein 10 [Tetranychus urticae]XP_015791564.1 transmembrane emp24 domain-containing protein 10 [Tetranychus urticae]
MLLKSDQEIGCSNFSYGKGNCALTSSSLQSSIAPRIMRNSSLINSTIVRAILMVLILSSLILNVDSIRFQLEPNTRRCLKEEMRKDVLVSGEYDLSEGVGVRTDLQVLDSKGHAALNRESIDKGKFVITADEDDIYDICFVSYLSPGHQSGPREVHLEMKHGVEAKSYDELAHIGKLKPLEMELTKLEDLSASIVTDFEHMKKREEEMRDTNESTNTRVLYLSIFSMFCLLGLATWQVLYLRKFFKTKKLID